MEYPKQTYEAFHQTWKSKIKLGLEALSHRHSWTFPLFSSWTIDDSLFWNIRRLRSFHMIQKQVNQIIWKQKWISLMKRWASKACIPIPDSNTVNIPNHWKTDDQMLPRKSQSKKTRFTDFSFMQPPEHNIVYELRAPRRAK